jgi:hypothetical protein
MAQTDATGATDAIDVFLESYPPPIADLAHLLRDLIRQAQTDVIERVRPGWRLIGYDLPKIPGARAVYFAWVMPEFEHVHIGWQMGTLMKDPKGVLRGAHLKLKKVRYLTYAAGDRIASKQVIDFTRDAARIARLSRGERELIALSHADRARLR